MKHFLTCRETANNEAWEAKICYIHLYFGEMANKIEKQAASPEARS